MLLKNYSALLKKVGLVTPLSFVFVIILLGMVSYWVFAYVRKCEKRAKAQGGLKLGWISTPFDGSHGGFTPAGRFPDVVEEFGNPSMLDKRPGGQAVWSKKDIPNHKPYDQIILIDEQIPHTKPAPHVDFLYASINFEVPENRIADVLELSESVYYDRLKKQLWARCHFMGANVATLYLAIKIATGEISIHDIATGDVDLYKSQVMSTMVGSASYEEDSQSEMEAYVREKVEGYKHTTTGVSSHGKRP